MNDILRSNSSEIRELFYAIEKANTHVSNYIKQQKPISAAYWRKIITMRGSKGGK